MRSYPEWKLPLKDEAAQSILLSPTDGMVFSILGQILTQSKIKLALPLTSRRQLGW